MLNVYVFKTNSEVRDNFPKDGANDQFSIIRQLKGPMDDMEEPGSDLQK